MKYYIFFITFFCINASAVISAADHHLALRSAIGRARRASTAHEASNLEGSTDSNPTQTAVPDTDPKHVVFGAFRFEEPVSAATTPQDDDGHSQSRRGSHPFDGSSMSFSSLQASAIEADQAAQTPAQKLRSCVQRAAENRRKSVSLAQSPMSASTLLNSSGSARLADNDQLTPMANSATMSAVVAPQQLNNGRVLLYCATSALTAATVTGAVMYKIRPQRQTRMFTGFEIPAAISGLGMVGSAIGLAGSAIGLAFVFRRFDNWVHSACLTKEQLLLNDFKEEIKALETTFTKKLNVHKQEVYQDLVTMTAQVDVGFAKIRNDTNQIVTPIIEALNHVGDLLEPTPTTDGSAAPQNHRAAAAMALHAAATAAQSTAQSIDNVHMVLPRPPKEKTSCCC